MQNLKKIRTDVVGSLQRPPLLKDARAKFEEGKLSAAEFRTARRRVAPRRPRLMTQAKTLRRARSEILPRTPVNALARGWLALPVSPQLLLRVRQRENRRSARNILCSR